MKNWRQCIIHENASIIDAVRAIDESGMQIALIVDDNEILRGVLTDGDIRRAVISGVDFSDKIQLIMKRNPVVVQIGESNDSIREVMKQKQIHQIPIVNGKGQVCDLVLFTDVIGRKRHSNPVVLMAGGLGSRLMPLTQLLPKPMLKVGEKPILEIILESFIEKGFYNFFLSVNYKSELIEDYFGDGSKWDVDIRYLKEKSKLGTAGSLSLMPEISEEPIFVMNGDIMTKVDFGKMLSYHIMEGADATMAVREYKNKVPYGVVDTDGNRIIGIMEKPEASYLVNAGIYILSPNVLKKIEKDSYLDMPGLYERVIQAGNKSIVFPIHEYWLDIGQKTDFDKAQLDYELIWKGKGKEDG